MIRPEPVIVVFGPTAVGKTAFIDFLFSRILSIEIISADSMQVYRYMNIGTAKPPPSLIARVPHHLIGIVEPSFQFNAGQFVHRADQLVSQIRRRGNFPVLCGGTAYYLRSFINGLPDSPPGKSSIRRELKRELETRGLASLLEELGKVDPITRSGLNENDSYRVLRALEVYRTSGRPLSSFSNPTESRTRYKFLRVGLKRPRPELYERINERVETMFASGLVEEFKTLLEMGYGFSDPGMRGIGYREFFEMRKGCQTICQVKESIKMNSRRYAKRQITFFKTLPEVLWEEADDVDRLAAPIENFVNEVNEVPT